MDPSQNLNCFLLSSFYEDVFNFDGIDHFRWKIIYFGIGLKLEVWQMLMDLSKYKLIVTLRRFNEKFCTIVTLFATLIFIYLYLSQFYNNLYSFEAWGWYIWSSEIAKVCQNFDRWWQWENEGLSEFDSWWWQFWQFAMILSHFVTLSLWNGSWEVIYNNYLINPECL